MFTRGQMFNEQHGGQRRWRTRMLLLHAAMLVAPVSLMSVHAWRGAPALGVCVFRSVMRVDCPACGITRSVMALLGGHVSQAFRLHPTGPVICGIVGVLTIYFSVVFVTGAQRIDWAWEIRMYKVSGRAAVAVLLIGWIVRFFLH